MSSGQSATVSPQASSLQDGAAQQQTEHGPDQSAGELLRAARESAGLHIAALAVMLKVPVKKLEALEASRFDLLPDMVFARALASSVCRTLKVDSTPVLERLPQTGTPQLIYQGSGINAPFRSVGGSVGSSTRPGLPKPALAAVMLLLLASAAILFWPVVSTQFNRLASAITSRIAADTSAVNAAAVSVETTAAVSADLGLRGERTLAGVLPLVSNASEPAGTLGAVPATPSSSQAASEAAAPLVDVPANSIIVFRATGESWVEVLDAKRQTVLRRTLAAGESVGVTGVLPLAATVGRASMTRVDVRGQGFDLGPWSKDNVARFEVK